MHDRRGGCICSTIAGYGAVWLALAVLLAIVATISIYAWSAGEETRAVRRLPVEQRLGLYQRTMENLKTICDPAPGRSMRNFCREQAELVLQLRECDDTCRVIARRHMSLPRP